MKSKTITILYLLSLAIIYIFAYLTFDSHIYIDGEQNTLAEVALILRALSYLGILLLAYIPVLYLFSYTLEKLKTKILYKLASVIPILSIAVYYVFKLELDSGNLLNYNALLYTSLSISLRTLYFVILIISLVTPTLIVLLKQFKK